MHLTFSLGSEDVGSPTTRLNYIHGNREWGDAR